MPRTAPVLLNLLLLLTTLPACRSRPEESSPDAWERVDLWRTAPVIELTPLEFKEATFRRISFLGAGEVRDLSLVPPEQLTAFPKRTSGQVRALEQRASTLIHWTIQPGRDAYFSFTPLGALNGCDCTYRVGIREPPDKVREIYRVKAKAVAPFAPAAVEVDLSPWAGRRIDLLTHIEGSSAAPPGQAIPSALWGSPALYSRKAIHVARHGGPPNILLIGIDTLRADELGAWGRNPTLTPSLDRLAGQSDVWLNAYSAFNVTNPSFASILTGLYGKNHGIYDLKTPLPPAQTTLAEILSGAGYDTLAVISASHLGDTHSGLGQGFREVHTATEHFAAELPVDLAMDWLTARRDKPFFIWLHLFDPHTPTLHQSPTPWGSAPPRPRVSRRCGRGSPSARRDPGASPRMCWAASATSTTVRWPISIARWAGCWTSWRAAGCWTTR